MEVRGGQERQVQEYSIGLFIGKGAVLNYSVRICCFGIYVIEM